VEKGFQEADQVIESKPDGVRTSGRRRNASVLVRWLDDRLEMWVNEQQPYHAKQ